METVRLKAGRFIGNHPNRDRPFLEQAAQETGYKIRISEDAVDIHGRPVHGDIAVYTQEPIGREHGPFWRRFRELREEAQGG